MTWRDDDAAPEIDYLLGLDLAQSGAAGADYTALAVLRRSEWDDGRPPTYAAIHLERWRDKRVARIPERATAVLRQLAAVHRAREFERTGVGATSLPTTYLVVDRTGVGPFGLEPLRRAGLSPIGIVIHGGDAVSRPDHETYRVPKRDLAGAINTLLQDGRLLIGAELPDAAVLRAELENFRAKIDIATGHDRYEAGTGEEWREGAHDDLVLAVGIAAWLGERLAGEVLTPAGPELMRHFSGWPT